MDGAEEIRRSKRLKTPENEDRLSALPDSLLHHILSFLPSTKQAIQSGVLSKRWRNQWPCVSNLLFDFTGMCSDFSPADIPLTSYAISRIVDRALLLHECSKIQKFQIIADRLYECKRDPTFEGKISFAVRKQAEELVLKFSPRSQVRLPEFFFCQPFLVKLELSGCYFDSTGMINWKSLKDLSLEKCFCGGEVITSIVSASPLLQPLQLKHCFYGSIELVIASKSLKRLVVYDPYCYVDIACPNLVEFDGCSVPVTYRNFGWCNKVLEKFLCDSPLLESLTLENVEFSSVRVASKVLKKFAFKGLISNEIAISCPHLEELGLAGWIASLRLMNLSSSVCAFIDLVYGQGCQATVVKQILESVQHLDELKFGNYFLESLSDLEIHAISHPLLKCKSLTLEGSYGFSFVHISGIAYALQSSPVIERLVVNLQAYKYQSLVDVSDLDHPKENYWKSNETHFSSLVSHLRTVEIIGFSQRQFKPSNVLDFVEFILKNASALEKMVLVLEECRTDFVYKVSEKLSSFPRCSASIIELVCPNS